jgi:hypothetical protein
MKTSFSLVDNSLYIYDGLKHHIAPISSKDAYAYLNDSKITKITYDAHAVERQLAALGLPFNSVINFYRWVEDHAIDLDNYWKALAAVDGSREYILLQNMLLWNYYRNSGILTPLIPFSIPQRLISNLSEANYQLVHRYKIPVSEFQPEALSQWLSLGLMKQLDGYIYLIDMSS